MSGLSCTPRSKIPSKFNCAQPGTSLEGRIVIRHDWEVAADCWLQSSTKHMHARTHTHTHTHTHTCTQTNTHTRTQTHTHVYLLSRAEVLSAMNINTSFRNLCDHSNRRAVLADDRSHHVTWHQDSANKETKDETVF